MILYRVTFKEVHEYDGAYTPSTWFAAENIGTLTKRLNLHDRWGRYEIKSIRESDRELEILK